MKKTLLLFITTATLTSCGDSKNDQAAFESYYNTAYSLYFTAPPNPFDSSDDSFADFAACSHKTSETSATLYRLSLKKPLTPNNTTLRTEAIFVKVPVSQNGYFTEFYGATYVTQQISKGSIFITLTDSDTATGSFDTFQKTPDGKVFLLNKDGSLVQLNCNSPSL